MASTINASNSGFGGIVSTGDSSGQLQLQTANTTAVTIDTSQNVGIGTTPGAFKLDVNGVMRSSSVTNPYLALYTNSTYTDYLQADSNGVDINAQGSRRVTFTTNNTERMRIDSSGNVGIGIVPTTGKLRVKGGNDNTFYLDNDGSQYTAMYMSNNGTIKTAFYWDNTQARTYLASVTAGVYLAQGATSWTAVSDERTKDIIEPIENAVEKVSTLRAVIGKYKTDEEGTRRPFLIAQDVQAVFPEAVDTKDEKEYGLRYTDTIPLLVAAIKELKEIVDAQAERIKALEAK